MRFVIFRTGLIQVSVWGGESPSELYIQKMKGGGAGGERRSGHTPPSVI